MTWAKPDHASRRAVERAANMAGLLTPATRTATYAGSGVVSRPKGEAKRNRALLAMAQDRPCLLLVPGCCNHRTDTTVAAHSNLSVHGKAGARKADDCYSVWACAACHSWLDQGNATFLQKEARFLATLYLQVLAWHGVAADPSEPARFRNAARWALEQLER